LAACRFDFAGTTVPIFVNEPGPFFLNSSSIFDLLSASVGCATEDCLDSGVGMVFEASAFAAEVGVAGVAFRGAVVFDSGFETAFGATGGFADVAGFALLGLTSILVDFALVADFPKMTGFSTSMGSMAFLGLPLFFTTSEDMVEGQLRSAKRKRWNNVDLVSWSLMWGSSAEICARKETRLKLGPLQLHTDITCTTRAALGFCWMAGLFAE